MSRSSSFCGPHGISEWDNHLPDFGFHRGNHSLVRGVGSRSQKKIQSKTSKRREVLNKLRERKGQWVRPKDIGGTTTSHHSNTLRELVSEGKVEKRRRTDTGIIAMRGNNYLYRLVEENPRHNRKMQKQKSQKKPLK